MGGRRCMGGLVDGWCVGGLVYGCVGGWMDG